MCVSFFFQEEEGIRDLVRYRGLGEVYKRQMESISQTVAASFFLPSPVAFGMQASVVGLDRNAWRATTRHLKVVDWLNACQNAAIPCICDVLMITESC